MVEPPIECGGDILVIGLGNSMRGDDGAGRAVARALAAMGRTEVRIVELNGEATELLTWLAGAARVFLVDACRAGEPAGTVRRFDLSRGTLPAVLDAASSHGFGMAQAIELARALGQLPQFCVVFTIEGAAYEPGTGLSPEVAQAVDQVAAMLRAEIVMRLQGGMAEHA